MRRRTPSERFEALSKTGPDGCVDWAGARLINGYGQFRVGGKTVYAHRFALERTGRPVPEGMHTDHLCGRRCCVNPAHLEIVTPQENVQRGKRTPLSADEVATMKADFLAFGGSRSAFASEFACRYGVKPSTVRAILNGQRWANVRAAA